MCKGALFEDAYQQVYGLHSAPWVTSHGIGHQLYLSLVIWWDCDDYKSQDPNV